MSASRWQPRPRHRRALRCSRRRRIRPQRQGWERRPPDWSDVRAPPDHTPYRTRFASEVRGDSTAAISS